MLEKSWIGHPLESIRTAASGRQEDMFMLYCWLSLDNGPPSERKSSAMALVRYVAMKTEVTEQIDHLNNSFRRRSRSRCDKPFVYHTSSTRERMSERLVAGLESGQTCLSSSSRSRSSCPPGLLPYL